MNVLLLGNGFDLNYHLPTKYINFLNTVQYLSTGPWFDIHTVGDVFGSPKLQKMDKDIAKSYKKYKEAYDSIPLPREIISDLAELAENPWYSYFSDSLNKEMGWIDFEKEIQKVIKGFQKLFQKDSLITCFDFSDKTTSIFEKMLVSKFGFFLEIPDNMGGYGARFSVREDFLIEEPVGTNLFTLNREKVVNYLYMALQILAQKLQVYLYVFIDRAVHSLATNNKLQQLNELTNADKVITFNYTHTYEKLYPGAEVYHIHGDVKNNIVLGVNPNTDDNIETVNTDFIRFKKYFQRVFYETDHGYLETIKELRHIKNTPSTIRLTVMGHSLDVTDKDVIAELFELAGEIQILYHEKKQVSSYISNLISMFGKETFDDWRISKKLTFLPQSSNNI